MGTEDDIRLIRTFRREQGISRAEFARQAEVSEKVVRSLDDDAAFNPTRRSLQKLLSVIPEGWTPSEDNDTGASTMEAAE